MKTLDEMIREIKSNPVRAERIAALRREMSEASHESKALSPEGRPLVSAS